MTDPTSQSASRQLQISLFTRSLPPSLQIPPQTYLLPSNWKRYHLSQLVNKILNPPQPIPFDFLINGEVLRTSLELWARRNGRVGEEEGVVDVEYVRSVLPPEEVGRVEQEDWVSGVSLARPGYILVSSYLSHLRILPMTQTPATTPNTGLYTLPLPSILGATSCAWISSPSTTANVRLAAGGVDRAIHIFEIPSLEPDIAASSANTSKEIMNLLGHTAPISSIISPTPNQLLSSSWDGLVHLYNIPNEIPTEHELPAEPVSYLPGQRKRRKVGEEARSGVIEGFNDGDVGGGGWRLGPEVVFRGHKGRVGGLVGDKLDAGRVWSVGWDGSVRGWDVETGAGSVVRQGAADKSMLCVDQWEGNGTLATGSMDRTISLWDTREATSLISLTLPTKFPVPSLKCHPTNTFTLANVTYSGNVQIWDVRSPKNPLFDVRKAGGKAGREVTERGKMLGERLLGMDWDGEVLVAGGEDGEVGIWRARGE